MAQPIDTNSNQRVGAPYLRWNRLVIKKNHTLDLCYNFYSTQSAPELNDAYFTIFQQHVSRMTIELKIIPGNFFSTHIIFFLLQQMHIRVRAQFYRRRIMKYLIKTNWCEKRCLILKKKQPRCVFLLVRKICEKSERPKSIDISRHLPTWKGADCKRSI